ncbi:uncharacterized protein UTRI_01614_B [Ustilago trichophora]|uniref:F-box domain-containing protein n=1 Tax=Ustilago trichophora TaxID=86804 RepID=A0A5C3E2L6_9BASI|nr:uncharacterized protein UTRI_01614_B [Ustilago trichophora]
MSADRGASTEADSQRELQVPRFSSYRPVASSSASRSQHHHTDPGSSSREHRRSRKRRRHQEASEDPTHVNSSSDRSRSSRRNRKDDRDHTSSRNRHSHTQSSHRSHRRRSRSPTSSRHLPAQSHASPTFDRDLFFTDTRGDRDALLYGQDQSKVPKAYRASRSLSAVGSTSRNSAATKPVNSPAEPPDASTLPSGIISAALTPAEEFIDIDFSSPSSDASGPRDLNHDPFDPTLPYAKRDPRYEQVGGGPIFQAPMPSTLELLKRQSKSRPLGIQHLPVELLQQILVYSRSSSLPLTCRYFRQACQSASVSVKVDYVLGRWVDHLISYITAKSCREKHRSCRMFAFRLAVLQRDHDPVWHDFVQALSEATLPCTLSAIRTASLDVITFVSELRICDSDVLGRVVSAAKAARLPAHFIPETDSSQTPSHLPLLPKRLFRRIELFDYAEVRREQPLDVRRDQSRPKKRRRRRNGADKIHDSETLLTDTNGSITVKGSLDSNTVHSPDDVYSAWLSQLLLSLASAPPRITGQIDVRPQDSILAANGSKQLSRHHDDAEAIKAKVGPVPSFDDLQMILVLLYQYRAGASSHQGYPLAMAVHRQAYSLVHLLLLFGADPNCKDGLAGQIAIRNGALDILHLLVTGPCLDADALTCLPFDAGPWPPHLGAPTFNLDQTHLRLAIQCRQWELVDYIWHKRQVSPDIACLRLIEKLRQ